MHDQRKVRENTVVVGIRKEETNQINHFTTEGFPSFSHGVDSFPKSALRYQSLIDLWSSGTSLMWTTKGSYWVTQVTIDDAWNQGLGGEKQEKTLILPREDLCFENMLLVKHLERLAKHYTILNFKAKLEVQGLLLLARQESRCLGHFLHFKSWMFMFMSGINYHLSAREAERGHFWPHRASHLSSLDAPLAFSCLSSPSAIPFPPFLQSGG